MYDKIDSF